MDLQYVREMKRKHIREVWSGIGLKDEAPRINTYNNVCLSPLGQIYDESLRGDSRLIFEDTGFCTRISDAEKTDFEYNTAFYGGYIRGKWGHFMTETIARMWALERLNLNTIDNIIFFSDSDSLGLTGNFKELFDLLGITAKVTIAQGDIRVKYLTVPEIGYEHDRFYTGEQAAVYRSITNAALKRSAPAGITPADKIFLSRAGLPGAKRNAINLDRLESYFEKNGFLTVHPERVSLVYLIHLMDNASEIATISGTLAHNFAFIRNAADKHLIILERHPWVNSFQISLNKMLGLPAVLVDGYHLPRAASSQDALMLFAPTAEFKAFAKDSGMSDEGAFVNDRRSTRHRELRRFLTRYRRYWCSGDGLCDWEIESGTAIAEAIAACKERYDEWIRRGMPVMWYDYLSPRALVRMLRSK